jgi:hypothetical protein
LCDSKEELQMGPRENLIFRMFYFAQYSIQKRPILYRVLSNF